MMMSVAATFYIYTTLIISAPDDGNRVQNIGYWLHIDTSEHHKKSSNILNTNQCNTRCEFNGMPHHLLYIYKLSHE
jgi:hypothetical protein